MDAICGYSIDEYIAMITDFHGYPAPGLIIGGYMVDLAMKNRPPGEFFDALCETAVCLPDAVQILTPCTCGNGWLRVVNVGRFALALYEKHGGAGVRVHLDAGKLGEYPAIREWFFKLKPKKEQDTERLLGEIIRAERGILGVTAVQVDESLIGGEKGGRTVLCPGCGESYPEKDGARCLACRGMVLYK